MIEWIMVPYRTVFHGPFPRILVLTLLHWEILRYMISDTEHTINESARD